MDLFPKYYYLIIFLLLSAGMFIYLKIAEKWSIVDQPNLRSSHQITTKRGAGILYLLAFVIYLMVSSNNNLTLILSGLILGGVGFIDDLKNLNFKIKLAIQLIVILSYLIVQDYLSLDWYYTILIFVFLIASINIFNFMDGINGLTILYSLSFLMSFYYINTEFISFINPNMLLVMIICNVIIGFLNIRTKAVCFIGDVGSISMGFLYATLALILMIKTNSFAPLVLIMVYAVDAGWTIMERLSLKENIFLPHRRHLYQILVNELRFSHILISISYFTIQMLLNMVWLLNYENKNSGIFLSTTFIILSICYLIIKKAVLKKLEKS
jgi:UDP-N-acetylmuramyl pentapeptide phosphotransferase/UDP-N-acetylglucosamine-1-phosphate transferase